MRLCTLTQNKLTESWEKVTETCTENLSPFFPISLCFSLVLIPYIVQARLEFESLMLQPLDFSDYRHVLLCADL